jgi:hypothetical protein
MKQRNTSIPDSELTGILLLSQAFTTKLMIFICAAVNKTSMKHEEYIDC